MDKYLWVTQFESWRVCLALTIANNRGSHFSTLWAQIQHFIRQTHSNEQTNRISAFLLLLPLHSIPTSLTHLSFYPHSHFFVCLAVQVHLFQMQMTLNFRDQATTRPAITGTREDRETFHLFQVVGMPRTLCLLTMFLLVVTEWSFMLIMVLVGHKHLRTHRWWFKLSIMDPWQGLRPSLSLFHLSSFRVSWPSSGTITKHHHPH